MWTKEQIEVLTYLSEMLSVFLLKKRQQERTQQIAEDFRTILDNQNAWIYIIDPETCKLKYLNAKTRREAPNAKVGMPCYKALMGQNQRCPGCPCVNILQTKTGSARMYSEVFGHNMLAEATLVKWEGTQSCMLTCRKLDGCTES